LDRVPLELPAEARLLPIALLASGLAMLGQIGRQWRQLALLRRPAFGRLETDADLHRFFATPGRHYCAMLRGDYDRLVAQGLRLRIVHQEEGLFTTTGRALRRGAAASRDVFIVVTEQPASAGA
jgi:hypothetical protein